MHHDDFGMIGDFLYASGCHLPATLGVDLRAVVGEVVDGQASACFDVLDHCRGQPDALACPHEANHAVHHVVVDMAVKHEIPFEPVKPRIGRTRVPGLYLFHFLGKQDYRRHFGFDLERFGRAEAADIDVFSCQFPALGMGVKIVELVPDVQVEDVPADFLALISDDRGRVSDKSTAIEAVCVNAGTVFSSRCMVKLAVVGPGYSAAGCDGYVIRIKPMSGASSMATDAAAGAPASTRTIPVIDG